MWCFSVNSKGAKDLNSSNYICQHLPMNFISQGYESPSKIERNFVYCVSTVIEPFDVCKETMKWPSPKIDS